jgi:hypothetical protein
MEKAYVESDGKKRIAPVHTILAHEMFHAFDGIRGLFDRRKVDGPTYEYTEVLEYRGAYFENKIRAELGRKYRKYYGGSDQASGSLLDSDGNPFLFPAPCLKKAP